MNTKERYLSNPIKKDLSEKMVFVGGPRQVGKTTMAKELISVNYKASYYTWDKIDQRRKALSGEWPPDVELIILDEFHKYPKWKGWLKGEYDVYKERFKFLLTGSARLNIYRRSGDSLQGRYHYYTLYPLSYAELNNYYPLTVPGQELIFKETYSNNDLASLLTFGGFPEPLFRQDLRFLRRWNNERIERFFKEDIRELTMIKDFGSLTLLADLLPQKVSSILSINSLANDLQVNFRTLSHWLDVFEQFYYSFRIPPYQSKKIASVRKEKKLYLWDWSSIEIMGARLENIVALHLLKYCSYMFEHDGWKVSLYYLRDSTGREVDFLVTFNEKPWFAVEVKSNDLQLSRHLYYFKYKLNIPYCYQLVNNLKKDYIRTDIRVMPIAKFLTAFI